MDLAMEMILESDVCGNRSSDLPIDHEFPPAVCSLPPLHEGMHRDGRCRWIEADEPHV